MESAEQEEERVKGGAEVAKQAAAGLALFAAAEAEAIEVDKDAAQKFKDETDVKIKALEAEAEALTGKDNKKARTEKSKEASALSKTPEYIDATRILKDQEPKNGNFVKSKAAPKAAAKAAAAPADEPAAAADDKKSGKDKPKKAAQAAGISPAERKELESLKDDIIKKKKELKEGGMSGGQINKDESIVAMVARMNELKEKENPGCLEAAKSEKKESGKKGKKLSAEQEALVGNLEQEIEEYRQKLAGPEFKYSKKEINADPDMQDMVKRLADMKK